MSDYKFFGENVSIERVRNDTYGNPRYVIHYLNVSRQLKLALGEDVINFRNDYILSLQAAGKGFKKFHNKQYGGGIIFQSYNVQNDLDYLESNVKKFISMNQVNNIFNSILF